MQFYSSQSFLKMGEVVNNFLKGVFNQSVCAVQPKCLISNNFRYDSIEDKLQVFTDRYDLKNRNIHLVGAGKAVLQMAVEVEKVLGSKLQSGIISVPSGVTKNYELNPKSVIKCFEGAENNLPDENSEYATKEIINLAKRMDEKCLIFVLLSGGGSALLPAPLPPATLAEKCQLIKQLSKSGANILELNAVRKRLSCIKGGKLAYLAYPAEVVTLLISDIVGIYPEFIASGPTFENDGDPRDAIRVVEKYFLQNSLSPSIKSILYSPDKSPEIPWDNLLVSNYILANNVSAVSAGYIEARLRGYSAVELSHMVTGDVESVAAEYCQLIVTIIKVLSRTIDENVARKIMKSFKNIDLHDDALNVLPKIEMRSNSNGLVLIAGGEPTVNVKGTGKGGRNQHLALSFSHKYDSERRRNAELNKYDVFFLSAGTDGIDGPTDAAGAIGHSDLVKESLYQHLSVEKFLMNHDSYNFFSKFSEGRNQIKVGHTNTNVMDIHALLLKYKAR